MRHSRPAFHALETIGIPSLMDLKINPGPGPTACGRAARLGPRNAPELASCCERQQIMANHSDDPIGQWIGTGGRLGAAR